MPEPVSTGAAILGAGALSAGAGLYGSSQAAKAQKSAANQAADTQMAMFNRQVELQEPFRQGGLTAQNRLLTLLGLEGGETGTPDYGRYAKDFTMADYQADPGYGFRLDEGMKVLERSAAARGGLLSGATLRGTQRFGQDLASQEYQNAFNRYQVNRANQLNPLQSLYGAGQTSANTLTAAAGQTGQGMANTQMAGGQARASGYIGGANAITSALNTGAGLYVQRPLYEALANRNFTPGNAMLPFVAGGFSPSALDPTRFGGAGAG
jgi:hypothetical protein